MLPVVIDRQSFIAAYRLSPEEMCRDILDRHRDTVRVQKPVVAVANLVRIITATLEAANRDGFSSMSLRTLAESSGLSMGSLYAYFDSKDTLAMMILRQVQAVVERVFASPEDSSADPRQRLRWILSAHITLTEILQPWFIFAFMEARSFDQQARTYVLDSELFTERLIGDALLEGQKQNAFRLTDPHMTAAHIKPLLQDWYIKRWKYRRRKVSAEAYVESVTRFVERAAGIVEETTETGPAAKPPRPKRIASRVVG